MHTQDKVEGEAIIQARLNICKIDMVAEFFEVLGVPATNRNQLTNKAYDFIIELALGKSMITLQESLIDSFGHMQMRGIPFNMERSSKLRKAMISESTARDFDSESIKKASAVIPQHAIDAMNKRIQEIPTDDEPTQLNDNEETRAVFDNKDVGMPEQVDDANSDKKSKRRKKS